MAASHASTLQHATTSCSCLAGVLEASPYSIDERRVPELITVLGSQPAGDVSRCHYFRQARNYPRNSAWWTEARWVWTVCLRLLSGSVAAAIWTQAFCAWVQHANHSPTEWRERALKRWKKIKTSSVRELTEVSCRSCKNRLRVLLFVSAAGRLILFLRVD